MPIQTRARTWLAALLIFLLTLALFGRTVGNGFVNFDDNVYVYANPIVSHGLTFTGLIRSFSEPHARNWHPLTTISHMLDCAIFGLNPAGPHAINIFLHAVAAALLLVALHAFTGSIWRSAFVAGIFALHPLRVESVAWISERKDVLSATLFMCALLAYAHYRRAPDWRRFLLVIFAFAAGLMAKPILVSLPIVLLLIDFWIAHPQHRAAHFPRISAGRAIIEKVPLFLLSAASCAVTLWAAGSGNGALVQMPLLDRLGNAVLSYCVYIAQLFWPVDLAVFYPLPIAPVEMAVIIGAAAVIIIVSALAIFLRNRLPYFFTGWFWYLIVLLPVIGIVQIGLQAHADRYTYLPHIGLLIALTWGGIALLRKIHAVPVAAPVGIAVLGLCAWQTWNQIGFWRDSETLWNRALAVTQDNETALFNLGVIYQDRGDLDAALAKYRAALQLLERRSDPRYNLSRALVHNNLGNVAADLRDSDEATREYRAAIDLIPQYSGAHVNLGQLYAQQKEWKSALEEFENAIRAQPRDADAQYRAGVTLMRLKRVDEAIAHYNKALATQPFFAAAELDLGNAMLEQGHFEDAAAHYERATQIDPQNADAHFNFARMLFQQRRVAEAIGEYERVVALQPNDPEAHLALGNALAAAASEKRAADEIEKALQLAPDSVSALNNLAWLLATAADSSIKNPARAVELGEKAERLAPEPNAIIYHTLAAAYAANGKTDHAITAAERAQKLAEDAGDKDLADAVKKELEEYRKKQGTGSSEQEGGKQ